MEASEPLVQHQHRPRVMLILVHCLTTGVHTQLTSPDPGATLCCILHISTYMFLCECTREKPQQQSGITSQFQPHSHNNFSKKHILPAGNRCLFKINLRNAA